ncbi:MAG: hypothetical protein K0S37_4615, partial [Microbacterium sp.]|nr:hypothetical protein [Microbacterium sp.]
GFGYGIRDASDAEESVTLAPVASGSRWDLITMRRDWDENVSAFHVVQGSSAREIPARATAFAQLDDQPLWLARVQAGFSQVRELIDLRVWGGDGGAFAVDELVLQYLNRIGTRIRIGTALWERVIDSLGSPSWVRNDSVTFQRAGAAIQGIGVPTESVTGPLIVKTGHLTDSGANAFGNQYMSPVVFETPFPNRLLSVQTQQIQIGDAAAGPELVIDDAKREGFRAFYPGFNQTVKRSFLWTAIGY